MYLGPVFGTDEIAKALPTERKAFQAADAMWRTIMDSARAMPAVLSNTDKVSHLHENLLHQQLKVQHTNGTRPAAPHCVLTSDAASLTGQQLDLSTLS